MLEVKHLSFEIEDAGARRSILKDISFSVEDGEMMVITGPNGSGKSTLAKLIMGIEKATGGEVLLDGIDLSEETIDQRAKAGIGFAFQQPPRFKGMKISRLLQLAAGEENTPDQCELLSAVGLCAKEYVGREADQTLSGGEMKRLEIATVLSRPHRICIFDEPEAGIDLWSFSMLIQQFEKIHREKKESILLISHQERIIKMADRVMVLRDGEITGLGSPQEIMPALFESSDDSRCPACQSEEGCK